MQPLIFALCVVFALGCVNAQASAWQPSPGHTQVPAGHDRDDIGVGAESGT